MLVNSILSFLTIFSKGLFHRVIKIGIAWYKLHTFLHIYSFKHSEEKALEKHCEKGEIAQNEQGENEQFHLFPQCFLCNVYLKIL